MTDHMSAYQLLALYHMSYCLYFVNFPIKVLLMIKFDSTRFRMLLLARKIPKTFHIKRSDTNINICSIFMLLACDKGYFGITP